MQFKTRRVIFIGIKQVSLETISLDSNRNYSDPLTIGSLGTATPTR